MRSSEILEYVHRSSVYLSLDPDFFLDFETVSLMHIPPTSWPGIMVTLKLKPVWYINKPQYLLGSWEIDGVLKERLLGIHHSVQCRKICTDYIFFLWRNRWGLCGLSKNKWNMNMNNTVLLLLVLLFAVRLHSWWVFKTSWLLRFVSLSQMRKLFDIFNRGDIIAVFWE